MTGEREMTQEEKFKKIQEEQEVFVKELNALYEKHGVRKAMCFVESRDGIIIGPEFQMTATDKLGFIEFMRINAHTRQAAYVNSAMQHEFKYMMEQEKKNKPHLIKPT